MTPDQRVLLEDKAALWRKASTQGNMEMRDYHRRCADALDAAMAAAQPQVGWKLVPVEPTEAMVDAGEVASNAIGAAMLERDLSDHPEGLPDYDGGDRAKAIWSAMLAACPAVGDEA